MTNYKSKYRVALPYDRQEISLTQLVYTVLACVTVSVQV
jgi:hypothetical protein